MATGDYISATVGPTFIKMGDHILINLNTVKRIVLTKEHVEFLYMDGTEQRFKVEDAMTFDKTIANMVNYHQAGFLT